MGRRPILRKGGWVNAAINRGVNPLSIAQCMTTALRVPPECFALSSLMLLRLVLRTIRKAVRLGHCDGLSSEHESREAAIVRVRH
jgi:hypothetical protein